MESLLVVFLEMLHSKDIDRESILSGDTFFSREELINQFSTGVFLESIRGSRLLWQNLTGNMDSRAHSCCRTALLYALWGDNKEAEKWLGKAERFVQDLARPNYIRGLIEGSQGNLDRAKEFFTISLLGRSKKETKVRIEELMDCVDLFQ